MRLRFSSPRNGAFRCSPVRGCAFELQCRTMGALLSQPRLLFIAGKERQIVERGKKKSLEDLRARGETKDCKDLSELLSVTAEDPAMQDRARGSSGSTNCSFLPQVFSYLFPLCPGQRGMPLVPKAARGSLPVHFLLKVS